jgi:hypothetical protein
MAKSYRIPEVSMTTSDLDGDHMAYLYFCFLAQNSSERYKLTSTKASVESLPLSITGKSRAAKSRTFNLPGIWG